MTPFNVSRTARENVLDWVGEDSRMLMLIGYCDSNGVKMNFFPGVNYCYIDVLAPNGRTVKAPGDMHSMSINVDDDVVTLFGSDNIAAGLVSLDQLFDAVVAGKEISEDLRSLLEL